MKIEVHRKDGEIENRPVSKGGKLFDLITYGGFAAVGTFFATIPLANLFLQGGRFHNAFLAVERGLQKVGLSERLAKHGANTFATIHGGNLMLIPVSIMEHFRSPIVKAFNRMLNDPTDPQSIEEAPPQTLPSIIKARLIAAATVFTGFVGAETLVGPARFENALKTAGTKWAKFRGKEIEVLNPKTGVMEFSKAYHFGHTGALDVLATASSASMLYVGSHFFAKRAYENRVTKDYLEQKRAGTLDAKPAENTAPLIQTQDTPGAVINSAQREDTLESAPQQPTLAAL